MFSLAVIEREKTAYIASQDEQYFNLQNHMLLV